MPPTLSRLYDLLQDDMLARRNPNDLTGPFRTFNADKTCMLDRPHMTEASKLEDQAKAMKHRAKQVKAQQKVKRDQAALAKVNRSLP